jgi:hypothetical protein
VAQKADPELVTSGPYRFVRHPIYTGILTGVLGTALATNLLGLIIVGVLGAYFSAQVLSSRSRSRRESAPWRRPANARPTTEVAKWAASVGDGASTWPDLNEHQVRRACSVDTRPSSAG